MMIFFIIAGAIIVVFLALGTNRKTATEEVNVNDFHSVGLSRLINEIDGFGVYLVLIWTIIALFVLFKIALG